MEKKTNKKNISPQTIQRKTDKHKPHRKSMAKSGGEFMTVVKKSNLTSGTVAFIIEVLQNGNHSHSMMQ